MELKHWWRVLAAMVLVMAAGPARAQVDEALVARVNGWPITVRQLDGAFEEALRNKKMHVLQLRSPATYKGEKQKVLDTLIDQALLAQEAAKKGIAPTEAQVDEAFAQARRAFKSEERFEMRLEEEGYDRASYRQRVRQLEAARLYVDSLRAAAAKTVTDEDVRAFYRDNPDKFNRPEMVRARHVLIRVRQGAPEEERQAARKRIDGILAEARAGRDLAELAREYSEDPTKAWGGELDPIARGQVPKAFEDAAFGLETGKLSGVVETPLGFHVIRLEERIPAVTIGEEQASERIRGYLQQQKGEDAIAAERVRLRGVAKIEYILPP